MSADVKKLLRIKERVEEMKRDADKAEGALQRIEEQIREEFKCKDLDAACDLLDVLEVQEKDAEEAFDKAQRKFEKKWGDLLK